MMTSNEIRNGFLDFFRSKGHTIVPSDSVIPQGDPTLLFTNAGMNQFKRIFLGLEDRGYRRAADSQKVLRVSGKHNDLEEVGRDHFHHTFFEMLGNWSFGDYYKKEAIGWAWELLAGVWKLPKDRLYATVYANDEEALGFWKTETDIDHSHISRHGEKDNFWEMGETGPCGPCSEIHMDMGEGSCPKSGQDGHVCGVNVDGCGRFVEIWNLVFIQYERQPDGSLKDLPSRHVDTGMGFERIVRVLQKKNSNYDTDLFYPVIKAVEKISGKIYGQGKEDISFRVVADHIRALVFTIGDGVLPSNEGRGYVIRRILRRAARHGRLLGLEEPFLFKLAPVVVEIMDSAYPDLKPRLEHIATVIKNEEENFASTIALGLSKLLESAAAITPPDKRAIPGEVLFKLYDTFGFPIDLAQEIASEQGLTLDLDGFQQALNQQRERARSARGEVAFTAEKGVDYPSCIFVGYQKLDQDTTVTSLFRQGQRLESAGPGEQVDITLEDTPFYAEGGGQAGDIGIIEGQDCRLRVTGTVKAFNQATVMKAEVLSGRVAPGARVRASVDQSARAATARHHTATHLLQAALRQVLGGHVQQQGSMVGPERLRFDFTHFAGPERGQLDQVERLVNLKIMDDLPVAEEHMPLAQAQSSGAMALFGEKYGQEVRVISCGDFSKELCGGTHVKRSGELGQFRIIREEAVAAGVRRIEAVAGEAAYQLAKQDQRLLAEIQETLLAGRDEILKKLNIQVDELKALEKARKEAAKQQLGSLVDGLAREVKEADNIALLIKLLDGYSQDDLREVADRLRAKLPNGVVVLAASEEGKFGFTIAVGEELVKAKKLMAGDIARKIAAATGGRGGGRPQLAQVGGKDDGRLGEHLAKVQSLITGQG